MSIGNPVSRLQAQAAQSRSILPDTPSRRKSPAQSPAKSPSAPASAPPRGSTYPSPTQRRTGLAILHQRIVDCRLCGRLRAYGEMLAENRRASYRDQEYWSKPVPGFGDENARVLILGLAPGAHGANRTGRPFTGDGSGDFMYPVLHELGFASKDRAVSRDDGLRLKGAWICSVVRCAPPGDKPTPQEIRNCAAHLSNELECLKKLRTVVCLGKIAFDGYLAHLVSTGVLKSKSGFKFGHAVEYHLPNGLHLLASYHPSLRNTNTGRLNKAMFARVFVRARELAGM